MVMEPFDIRTTCISSLRFLASFVHSCDTWKSFKTSFNFAIEDFDHMCILVLLVLNKFVKLASNAMRCDEFLGRTALERARDEYKTDVIAYLEHLELLENERVHYCARICMQT